MTDSASNQEQNRLKVKKICQAMVENKMSYIMGSRLILSFARGAGFHTDDPDILIIVGIESETDHIPSQSELAHWNRQAMAEQKDDWAGFEKWAQEVGKEACLNLISRL